MLNKWIDWVKKSNLWFSNYFTSNWCYQCIIALEDIHTHQYKDIYEYSYVQYIYNQLVMGYIDSKTCVKKDYIVLWNQMFHLSLFIPVIKRCVCGCVHACNTQQKPYHLILLHPHCNDDTNCTLYSISLSIVLEN